MPVMADGKVPTSHARGGLIISAIGADAQGLDVEQLSPGGQPAARCSQPGSDFWFVGPGSTRLHTELYLLNADSEPANANLSVQTDSGPLLNFRDSGIHVPPHSMVVQSLDKVLRAAKAVALHVTTSTGRVVAAVRETTSATKPGIWLPPAQQPGTSQALAGMPATAGTRELYITVPGDKAARITVTAVTPRGSYQPTGGSRVSLLPHLTTGIALPSLAGTPGSIVVRSDVPVAAELEVSGGPPGAPGAFIGGSGPITEQGVVAASPVGSAGTTDLVLSAPGHAASVKISQAGPGTALTGQAGTIVQIKARSSTQVRIAVPKHSKLAVVALLIIPVRGSGPVYAARLAGSHGSVQTILPVVSSPTRIDLRAVRASLVTVLGDGRS